MADFSAGIYNKKSDSLWHIAKSDFFISKSVKDTLNKSNFCDKRLKYRGFYRKNNLKSEAS